MEMHIIDFTIRNFKSYKDEAIFTFEALNDDFKPDNVFKVKLEDGSSIRLLKSAALYGANAAGKSNVIWAMKCLAFFAWHMTFYKYLFIRLQHQIRINDVKIGRDIML